MQLKFKDQDVLPQETLQCHSCYSWLFNLVSAFQYFAKLFLETIVKKKILKNGP